MDSVIRQGALRLLTNEGSCDVTLSCQGQRVLAHKLILSIASPVFRAILEDSSPEQTIIIFPDVSGSTMSLILDYIYTGSVVVYSDVIQDFLSLAEILGIKLDFDQRASLFEINTKMEDVKESDKIENIVSSTGRDDAIFNKKSLKRLPELVPLRGLRSLKEKRCCSYLLPSPWRPRSEGMYGDPRAEGAKVWDPNNNFHNSIGRYPSDNVLEEVPSKALRVPNLHERQSFSVDSLSQSSEASGRWGGCPLGTTEDSVERGVDIDRKDETRVGAGSGLDEAVDDVIDKDQKWEKRKPFECEECGKGFSQLRNYKYHRSVHEGTKEFAAKCPECGKTFNDKGYLSSHMKIHRDKKEYGCPHCPKRFNQRVAYNMHLRIHTGVKPHECSICGKSFSRKMLLKQHQRVHTGERPYSCPECGKTFADRSNMSLHARLHTGVKPYACSLCPKSFTKKHHLKTHMNFHTGLKPYECQKCGVSFSQSSNMRTHYKKCNGGGRANENPVGQAADS